MLIERKTTQHTGDVVCGKNALARRSASTVVTTGPDPELPKGRIHEEYTDTAIVASSRTTRKSIRPSHRVPLRGLPDADGFGLRASRCRRRANRSYCARDSRKRTSRLPRAGPSGSAFCADCGTPVYSSAISDPPAYSLRVGCLDERGLLPRASRSGAGPRSTGQWTCAKSPRSTGNSEPADHLQLGTKARHGEHAEALQRASDSQLQRRATLRHEQREPCTTPAAHAWRAVPRRASWAQASISWLPACDPCPYHFHHAEEKCSSSSKATERCAWLARCCPLRTEVTSPSSRPVRNIRTDHQYVGCPAEISLDQHARDTEICEYPDSGKYLAIASLSGSKVFDAIQRTTSNLDYWDGEP